MILDRLIKGKTYAPATLSINRTAYFMSSTANNTNMEQPAFDQMIMGSAFLTVINPLEVRLAVMKVATEVLWVTNPDSAPAKLAKTLLSVHLAISRRKRRVAICLAFSLIVLIPTKNKARPARTVPKISNIR